MFIVKKYFPVFLCGVFLIGCGVKTTQFPFHTSTPSLTMEMYAQETALPEASPDPYLAARLKMVAETIAGRGIKDEMVLNAMETVHRHIFVPEEYVHQAYEDHPLPIGYGQTISQPYIVAWMTELLELKPGEKVLEIGTGSGYQAAVLAAFGEIDVYSVEIVPELAQIAADRLAKLGYTQVKVKQGDGYYGWEENAPFDAIIVTAAPDHIPAPLVRQLREGGRIVIPIGPPGGRQDLWKFTLHEGEIQAYNLGGVAFVPFTGGGVESGGGEQSEP
jgi:protein-L-isoaspartate(D-aspartate) O-methyltransferase